MKAAARGQGEAPGQSAENKDRAKNYQVCGGSRNDQPVTDVELPKRGGVRFQSHSARSGDVPRPSTQTRVILMKRSLLVLAPIALLAAACSSDSTSPIQITAADVDQAAVISSSDATAEDVGILSASDMTMSGGAVQNVAGAGLMLDRISAAAAPSYAWTFGDGCTFSASTGRFTCPPITVGGLTLNRDYAFYDATQNAQSAYSASATASANFHVSVAGVHVVDTGADTVSRDRNLTVSGLAGAETSRTWNGTGTRNDGGYRQGTDATRNYHVNDNVTVSNVVVNLPRSSNPWPISGTITRHVVGTGSVQKSGVSKSFSVDRTVTITFNGTQNVTMTVGSNSYTLDLSTGVATKN